MTPALRELFQASYRELRPRAPMPDFHVSFYHFTNLNNTIRLRDQKIFVRLSDLLEGAPESVLRAIAHILLAKLYRKPIDRSHAARYRRHAASHALTEKQHLIRQMRGKKKLLGAQGNYYDLDEVFESLNARFFHGLLARPQMTWSERSSRQNLGHYDPAHNAIVVSRIFDRASVPRFAVEYLVYHEMLHLKHPVRLRGSRRCVHSREFQLEEKLFPQLPEAVAYLKDL